jgi:TonB family protein
MTQRTLVPVDVKPLNGDELKRPASRLTTPMDDRTVVPAGPSDAPPLTGKSNIPEHMPLGVLVERSLVPRGMPVKPLERSTAMRDAGEMALQVLDARTVVPAHIQPMNAEQLRELERPHPAPRELREVVDPDIFTTGNANLLVEPEEKHDTKWDFVVRMASIAIHIALIIFLISAPRIFPAHVPTQQEIDLARKQLSFVYMPPETPTPKPPTPKLRVDPKMLEKIAPPVEKPLLPAPAPPPPQPAKPLQELPEAPTPHVTPQVTPQPPQVAQNLSPPPPQPSQLDPVRPQPNKSLNLNLPDSSAGETLQHQLQDAIKRGNTGTYQQQSPIPGTGGQGPTMGNSVQILTPTEGVDFNPYIQRMLATIKRNWYAIMPQSALMGDRGVVLVTFQINPDGSVQQTDPLMERSSGKTPLDNAALSSIRASNPFEPLPKEFHGPYMRFGIYFLYNLPLDYINK